MSSHSQHESICSWTQHRGTHKHFVSLGFTLWFPCNQAPSSPWWGSEAPGAIQELSQSHYWGFSLSWDQSCPHKPGPTVGLEKFKLSSAKTQISLVLLEVKLGQQTHVRVLVFPKSEMIPNHRTCSTGETRTMAHSHEFSNSFADFAAVGGGFLGSVRCWGQSQLSG